MKNYSYVTLLTNDTYVYGVALLVESLARVKAKYPLHVLIIDDVSEATREILNQLHVTYEVVDTIATPEDIYQHNMQIDPGTATCWANCWTKFRVFDQTQFDKIVFLDADLMFLKNPDHLFEKPHMTAALDGEYFGLWQGWPHFNNGCVVIEPSHKLFEDILKFASTLNKDNVPSYVIADQEVLNLYYKDWPNKPELHLNKYYNVFAPYTTDAMIPDLDKNTQFIHYVGRKPWTFWLKTDAETYSEHYYAMGKEMVEARIKTLDWDKIHKKLKVVVYAICKNEIKSIEKWLKCFAEADYVCILDTGSEDGTWEYLNSQKKNYKNLILNQQTVIPWRYDKARNLSMELIPKDATICFMADIDEIIKEPGWCQKIKDVWDPLFDRATYTYNRDVDQATDTVSRAIPEFRIHSRYWDHYVNIVHEALVNKMGQKMFYMETCTPVDITVWHYPTKEGVTNYMELCERDLEECPDDWVMHLQLAIEYELRNEKEKALKHFEFLINTPNTLQLHEQARCYAGAGCIYAERGEIEKSLMYFREGRLLCPYYADNYLAAAQVYFNLNRFQEAIDLCTTALRTCQRAVWCNLFDVKSHFPFYILALSYYNSGDKLKALAFITIVNYYAISDEFKSLQKELAAQLYMEYNGQDYPQAQ